MDRACSSDQFIPNVDATVGGSLELETVVGLFPCFHFPGLAIWLGRGVKVRGGTVGTSSKFRMSLAVDVVLPR